MNLFIHKLLCWATRSNYALPEYVKMVGNQCGWLASPKLLGRFWVTSGEFIPNSPHPIGH
jgi:hypothetical protein